MACWKNALEDEEQHICFLSSFTCYLHLPGIMFLVLLHIDSKNTHFTFSLQDKYGSSVQLMYIQIQLFLLLGTFEIGVHFFEKIKVMGKKGNCVNNF